MNRHKVNPQIFDEKHNSLIQIHCKLADTTNLFGEMGRGSGKTTEIVAPRAVRISHDMPRSQIIFAAPTYVMLLENIIPGVLKYFNQHYIKDVHFCFGKRPPKHFKQPLREVLDYRHVISTVWGTNFQLVSGDRPESAVGKDAAHLIMDEMLRIPPDVVTERIFPTLRGDRTIFGHSHYFMGITGFSSAPNYETDYDWFTEYEKDVNAELIDKIMYIAYEVDKAIFHQLSLKDTNPEKSQNYARFAQRWSRWLSIVRNGQTSYFKASSFSNVQVLGLDYITRQFKNTKDFDKFKTNILNIRNRTVKNKFFAKFDKKHIYNDSYLYNRIDEVNITEDGDIQRSASDLKYYDRQKPIYAGWDPGAFMSLVVGQKFEAERMLRIQKNFYCITPEQHAEMAKKFDKYFAGHRNKDIMLHYDRAANQAKYKDSNNPDGDLFDSDAKLFKIELEKLGWHVNLLSIGKRTIFYWEHYNLLGILFAETDRKIDRIRIDGNECEELISSINNSPVKKSQGKIELDKSSEKLPYEDQVLYSTQISSALMYLLFGEYEKALPALTDDSPDVVLN